MKKFFIGLLSFEVMKKYKRQWGILVVMILLFGLLSGCSRADLLNYLDSRDTKYFKEMMANIIVTFDNESVEDLMNLFSINARKANPDLEGQIESFFSVYNGPTEIEEIRYSTSGGEHIDHGKRRTELINSYDIIIKADGKRYFLVIEMVSKDDFDVNYEGIQTLNVSTEEAHESEYFVNYYSGEDRGGDLPGFYYQDSTKMREDIRWIEGRPWRYTYYERELDVEDIVSIVDEDDDFYNLVAQIGEPNCLWDTFAYYYYEINDDQFAVCKIDDISHTIRTRVDGRVARPNVVVAIYIADAEENLETVWMADDIVQVAGNYYSFYPVDRDLSEDDFLEFMARSNSLSQLKDEFGTPNIDEPTIWRCFYLLSDKTYVECHFLGDDIKDLSIVDENNRLYTIWELNELED